MEKKIEIFDILKEINGKNYGYLESLDEESRKGFVPYVVYQWLQSSDDVGQIEILNYINSRIFMLGEHPDLLYRMFCVSSKKKYQKYSWIFKKVVKDERESIISQYLGCSRRVARYYKDMYNDGDIQEMLEGLGYSDKEIVKLKL